MTRKRKDPNRYKAPGGKRGYQVRHLKPEMRGALRSAMERPSAVPPLTDFRGERG